MTAWKQVMWVGTQTVKDFRCIFKNIKTRACNVVLAVTLSGIEQQSDGDD